MFLTGYSAIIARRAFQSYSGCVSINERGEMSNPFTIVTAGETASTSASEGIHSLVLIITSFLSVCSHLCFQGRPSNFLTSGLHGKYKVIVYVYDQQEEGGRQERWWGKYDPSLLYIAIKMS